MRRTDLRRTDTPVYVRHKLQPVLDGINRILNIACATATIETLQVKEQLNSTNQAPAQCGSSIQARCAKDNHTRPDWKRLQCHSLLICNTRWALWVNRQSHRPSHSRRGLGSAKTPASFGRIQIWRERRCWSDRRTPRRT